MFLCPVTYKMLAYLSFLLEIPFYLFILFIFHRINAHASFILTAICRVKCCTQTSVYSFTSTPCTHDLRLFVRLEINLRKSTQVVRWHVPFAYTPIRILTNICGESELGSVQLTTTPCGELLRF